MTRHDARVPGGAKVPGADFSVREFTRSANGSHRAGLRLETYSDSPLDPATLDAIGVLSRLERSALGYLRSVLVTPTHSDARVTAFLVTWAYEKYWLADALERVLASHPAPAPPPTRTSLDARLRLAWRGAGERLEPIRESVVANLIGEDVIAVHCITGALDEWITQAAYEHLAETTTHEQLRTTLTELLAVKRRHSDFFTGQARDRLAGSPRAQSLARRRLRRTAVPLGSLEEPARLLDRFLGDWVGPAAIGAIDRRLDGYPGLDGLHLAARAAARATRQARRGGVASQGSPA